MKKVTGWAAIIAVPTAITGFYGQNRSLSGRRHPMGGTDVRHSYRDPVPRCCSSRSNARIGSEPGGDHSARLPKTGTLRPRGGCLCGSPLPWGAWSVVRIGLPRPRSGRPWNPPGPWRRTASHECRAELFLAVIDEGMQTCGSVPRRGDGVAGVGLIVALRRVGQNPPHLVWAILMGCVRSGADLTRVGSGIPRGSRYLSLVERGARCRLVWSPSRPGCSEFSRRFHVKAPLTRMMLTPARG